MKNCHRPKGGGGPFKSGGRNSNSMAPAAGTERGKRTLPSRGRIRGGKTQVEQSRHNHTMGRQLVGLAAKEKEL